MKKYGVCNIEEFKNFIFYSHIHDSRVKTIPNEKSIVLKIHNEHFGIEYEFIFSEIEAILFLKADTHRPSDTVYAFSLEEDFSLLPNCIPIQKERSKDLLYILIEMLSGDTFHIVSKTILVSVSSSIGVEI